MSETAPICNTCRSCLEWGFKAICTHPKGKKLVEPKYGRVRPGHERHAWTTYKEPACKHYEKSTPRIKITVITEEDKALLALALGEPETKETQHE